MAATGKGQLFSKDQVLIDINCDMGEGMNTDAELMPYISSASIACGYHAGDINLMNATVELALKYNVNIGAHPSYPDKENFGRTAMLLSPAEVYAIVTRQINDLTAICKSHNTKLQHVKPHGALYNTAAKDNNIAAAIARAIKENDPALILFGLPNSCLQQAATETGISFWAEAFADRTYQPGGSLTPRQQPNALIETENDSVKQVLQIVHEKTLTAVDGTIMNTDVQTICIHGDGKHALVLAKAIHRALRMPAK